VSAEKKIRDLQVIIDDLFDKFLLLFLQILIFTRFACCLDSMIYDPSSGRT
jgi:hypothetical protein